MLRGLYAAATGMMTARDKMDIASNNIANAETTGFKKDGAVLSTFHEVVLKRVNDPYSDSRTNAVGAYHFGTRVDEVYTDFGQGPAEYTGKQTDMAITGDGFFVVETPQGEAYTRCGEFFVNAQGELVNNDGCYVLGENGVIRVGNGNFTVDETGVVTVRGEAADTLRIVRFEDAGALYKLGDNLYGAYDGAAPGAAQEFSVLQGYKEGANVEVSDEMVDMIAVYRAYEASQKILSMTDETLGLAVNELGGLR